MRQLAGGGVVEEVLQARDVRRCTWRAVEEDAGAGRLGIIDAPVTLPVSEVLDEVGRGSVKKVSPTQAERGRRVEVRAVGEGGPEERAEVVIGEREGVGDGVEERDVALGVVAHRALAVDGPAAVLVVVGDDEAVHLAVVPLGCTSFQPWLVSSKQ